MKTKENLERIRVAIRNLETAMEARAEREHWNKFEQLSSKRDTLRWVLVMDWGDE